MTAPRLQPSMSAGFIGQGGQQAMDVVGVCLTVAPWEGSSRVLRDSPRRS